MKTKEQILEDCFGELGDPERELTSKPYQAIMEAMDEYAKQQAIAFSMWALEKAWYDDNCGSAGMWNLHEDNYDPEQQFRFTPAEFYAQFLEHQNKNKS